MEEIQVNFGPPRFVIKAFPVAKKSGDFSLSIPLGSQFMGIDAPAFDPENVHVMWAISLTDLPNMITKMRVVYEGESFGAEPEVETYELEDGSILEEHCPGFFPLGQWTEQTADGSWRRGYIVQYEEDVLPTERKEGETNESSEAPETPEAPEPSV